MSKEKFNEESNQEVKNLKPTRNYPKIIGRVIIAILLLVVLVLGIASYYMFDLGVSAKSDKSIAFDNTSTHNNNSTYTPTTSQKPNDFFQEQKYKDRYIENEGLRLHAYDFNQGSDTYIINVHGYGSEGLRTGASSKWFYDRGYNVLAVDCRGHGKSEGDYIGMGWLDRKDIVAWVNQLVKENPKVKIILFGVSMGGATVMNTTGEDLPSNVQLAIEDCGFTASWDIFAYQMREIFGLQTFPIMNLANSLTKLKAGYNLHDGAINQVKKAKIPTLYIHGTADRFVPFGMLKKIFKASKAPDKEKLVIQGVGHNEGMFKQPGLYWKTVDQFINKHHK